MSKAALEAWERWLSSTPTMVVSKMLMSREQYLDLLCGLELWDPTGEKEDRIWLSWLWWCLLYIQFAICEELRRREPKFFDTSYVWSPADEGGS